MTTQQNEILLNKIFCPSLSLSQNHQNFEQKNSQSTVISDTIFIVIGKSANLKP